MSERTNERTNGWMDGWMDGWGCLLLYLLGYGCLKLWNTYLYTPLQIGLSYLLERKTRKTIYGKPSQVVCLNVLTYSVIYIGISGVKTIVHELHMKGQGHGQRGNPCL